VLAGFGASHTIDVTNLALLVLRCAIGGMILAHGLNKFFGGGKIPGTARWFESIGMRPGRLNALAAATTEVGSGVLLLLGLLTPFAAAGVIAIMIVAIVTVHRKVGYFVFRPGQGSLDYAIGYWHHSRFAGAVIALALGVGGAALQLLAVWRPEPTKS
jgi:putative oxidoreductase